MVTAQGKVNKQIFRSICERIVEDGDILSVVTDLLKPENDNEAYRQALVASLAKAEAQARTAMREHVIQNQQQLLERAAQTSGLRATAAELASATGALVDEVQGTYRRIKDSHQKLEEATKNLQEQRDTLVTLRAVATCQQKWAQVTRMISGPAAASKDETQPEELGADEVQLHVKGLPVHAVSDFASAVRATLAALAEPACRNVSALASLRLQAQGAADAALAECSQRLQNAVDNLNTTEVGMILVSAATLGGLTRLVDQQLSKLAAETADEAKRAFNISRISGGSASADDEQHSFPPDAERSAWQAALWDSGVDRLLTKLAAAATKAWVLQSCLLGSKPRDTHARLPGGLKFPSLFACVIHDLLSSSYAPQDHSMLPSQAQLPTTAADIGAWLPSASAIGVQGLWGFWWSAVCASLSAQVQSLPRSSFVFDELTAQYPRLRGALSDCLSSVQRSCASRLIDDSSAMREGVPSVALHTALQRCATSATDTDFQGRFEALQVALAISTEECHRGALGCGSLVHARHLYRAVDRCASSFVRSREDEMLALAASCVHGSTQLVQEIHDPHAALPVLHRCIQQHVHHKDECDGHIPSFADVTAVVKACSAAMMSAPGDGALLYELSTSVQRAVTVVSAGTLQLAGGAAALQAEGAHWQPTPCQRTACALLTRLQQLATGLRQSVDAAVKRASALSAGSHGASRGAFVCSGRQAETLFSQRLQGASSSSSGGAAATAASTAAECVPGAKVLLAHVWQPASCLLAATSSCLVTSYASGLRRSLLSVVAGIASEGYGAAAATGGEGGHDEAHWVRQLHQACASVSKYHLAALPMEGGLRQRVASLLGSQIRHGVLLLAAAQQSLPDAARMQLSQDVAHSEACLDEHLGAGLAAECASFGALRQLLQLSDAQLCEAADTLREEGDVAASVHAHAAASVPLDCLLLLLLSRVRASLPYEQGGQAAHEWAAHQAATGSAAQRAEDMLHMVQSCIGRSSPSADVGAGKGVEGGDAGDLSCLGWLQSAAPTVVAHFIKQQHSSQ